MSDVLSQEEVDKMLNGDVAAAAPKEPPKEEPPSRAAVEQENIQASQKSAEPELVLEAISMRLQEKLKEVLDIPLALRVELGRTKFLLGDLLKLHKGSVIELAQGVGDPLSVLVNGRNIASGEVVVVKEKFGLRVTSIMAQDDRIRSLGK